MAKVEWSTGIDSVSGALSKPSKSGQHSCTKMLLATHRIAETTSSDCNRCVSAYASPLSQQQSLLVRTAWSTRRPTRQRSSRRRTLRTAKRP